jgi:hypothetical protein
MALLARDVVVLRIQFSRGRRRVKRHAVSSSSKRSFFGDMQAYGEEGVRFYTKQKSVMQRWPESNAVRPFMA